jgi:Holliday junction resolvase RusA-like endonuclease
MAPDYSVSSIQYRTTDHPDPIISFTVNGDPPAQERCRMGRENPNKKRNIYDPSCNEKKKWKNTLSNSHTEQGLDCFPFFDYNFTNEKICNGLKLDVCFHLPRNKNDFKIINGHYVLKPQYQLYPVKKDIDNMIKFIMDAMHTILYDDDAAIVDLHASKRFIVQLDGEEQKLPFTTISLYPIK